MNFIEEIEIWAEIAETNNRYSVSSFGRFVNNKNKKFCQPVYDQKGYLRIRLYHNSKEARTYKAHRLVAKYFVPNPFDKPEVNHDDGDKKNNFYKNLIWSTGSENVKHAFEKKLKVNTAYQRECAAKILTGNKYSAKTVINIETKEVFETVKDAAKSIGYSRSALSGMLTGFRKNHTKIRYKDEL